VAAVGPSGETLLDYSLYDARRAGFDRLVFVIRRDIEEPFRQAVGRRFEAIMDVAYAFQELDVVPTGALAPRGTRRKPWGTGQAVLAAASVVDGPFGVANADDFYGAASYGALAAFLRGPAAADEWCLVAFRLAETLSENGSVARGICTEGPPGFMRSVTEVVGIESHGGQIVAGGAAARRVLTGDEPVSLNLWGFTPELFGVLEESFRQFLERCAGDDQAEFYLPAVVNRRVENGTARVRMLPTTDPWFGITHPQDAPLVAARLRRLVDAGAYPSPLFAS
jgi:hypothetical protein